MFTRWFNCTGQIPLLCMVVNLEFWLANSNFAPGLNVGSLSDRVWLPCQRGWGFYGSLAGLFIFLLVVYYTGPYKASTINILWVCWSSRRTLLPPLCPPSCNSLNLRWTSVVRGTSGSVCVHPPPPLPPPPPPSLRASEELSCLGVIQKKMTVNATDDSYDKARQSMAQAEEETRSRGAIVIKHGGRYQGQCVTRCCTCSTAWQTAAVTETPHNPQSAISVVTMVTSDIVTASLDFSEGILSLFSQSSFYRQIQVFQFYAQTLMTFRTDPFWDNISVFFFFFWTSS